jgi:hypothetical protein
MWRGVAWRGVAWRGGKAHTQTAVNESVTQAVVGKAVQIVDGPTVMASIQGRHGLHVAPRRSAYHPLWDSGVASPAVGLSCG